MAATIGIKLANGDFYSLMEENTAVKKRLVLTTAHDNQNSIQIDLYKSQTKTIADSVYIGTLVAENIHGQPKGTPSIELVVTSTADGVVNAELVNTGNGEHHDLSLHLKSFEEDPVDYSDIDVETAPETPGTELHTKSSAVKTVSKRRKFHLLLIIGLWIILVLAACLGLRFFLFTGDSRKSPEPPVENERMEISNNQARKQRGMVGSNKVLQSGFNTYLTASMPPVSGFLAVNPSPRMKNMTP